MNSNNTTMNVLLTGTDEVFLERAGRFLDAINEVVHRDVLIDDPKQLSAIANNDDDLMVHVLSSLPMEELDSLLHIPERPLVLITTGTQPLTGQQLAQIRKRGNSFVVDPPFNQHELLSILDQLHDDILLKRAPVKASAERHPDSRLVVFTGAGSGAGVSLITACIARLLSRGKNAETQPVLLLDGDWRYGSQATLNDCRPEHDLRNLLARQDMDQTAFNSYHTEVGPHLAFLGMSPEHLGTASSVKSIDRILVQLLRHIRQKPGITLADIPSRNDDYLTSMIADADHLVLILRPEIDGIRRARLLLDEAMTVLGPEQVTVVVNGSNRYTTIGQAAIKQSLGLEPVIIPEDQRAVIPALEAGRLPMDSDPRSPFSRSLKLLMARLQPAHTLEPGPLFRLREWSHVFRSVH
ncbi:AAA family ATPase [Endozoicomonas atrinae]|uniref:AAA family ATPase n=1 Tax=Endozoicomonas atrinae TaxID=1333660 RepID=UPI0008268320|nr:hypothetical protein [Endozoicomonas atrinae]